MTCFLLVQFRFLFGLSGLAAVLEPLFFFWGGAVVVVEAVEVTSLVKFEAVLLTFEYRFGEDGGVRLLYGDC